MTDLAGCTGSSQRHPDRLADQNKKGLDRFREYSFQDLRLQHRVDANLAKNTA